MEANTKQTKWYIPCCFNEECTDCKGTGKIYPVRCPIYYYKGLNTIRLLYENYTDRNILPYSGSLIEQPKVLFDYFTAITHYVYIMREIKEKEKERKQELISKMKSRINGN